MTMIGRWIRVDRLLRLVDVELHPVELLQQIVRELDVRLVDLVDEEHRTRLGGEGFPELALDDVVVDVVDPVVAELRVAKARDRVVLVQPLARLRDRLDVPLDEGGADRARHLLGEHRLARAGLSLDEERPFEGDGGVHREHQVLGGDVGIGTFESSLRHRASFSLGGRAGGRQCRRSDPAGRSGRWGRIRAMHTRMTIGGREAGAHPPDEFEMPVEAVEIEAPGLAPWRAGSDGVDYVHTLDSGRPGPHVMVSAVVHGNELCGAIVLDELLRAEVRPSGGRLTLAFMNVDAYERFDPEHPVLSRYVDEDFNRLWSREALFGRRDSVELRRATRAPADPRRRRLPARSALDAVRRGAPRPVRHHPQGPGLRARSRPLRPHRARRGPRGGPADAGLRRVRRRREPSHRAPRRVRPALEARDGGDGEAGRVPLPRPLRSPAAGAASPGGRGGGEGSSRSPSR